MKTAYTALATLVVLIGLSVGLSVAVASEPPLPPCETEDADYDCIWDASEQGNGQGRDFIVLDGVTFYPEG